MNEISERIKVSKASVSLWVRDIELTPLQKKELSEKGLKKENIERRRTTRLANENARRQIIIDGAKLDIVNEFSQRELLMLGAALYWAEGGKTKMLTRFSNGDPRIIRFMMKFFRKICNVPEGKFRGYIHIHQHLNVSVAERYWSDVSGIPLSQFYKTYNIPNKASKNKKDSLPYGTFEIYVCNTELFLKIKGWIEQLYILNEALK